MNLSIGAVAAAETEAEVAFRRVAADLHRFDDCISTCRCESGNRGIRKIVVQAVKAQYDEISHVVVAINGSPPRGVFVVNPEARDVVYFASFGRPRRLEPWRSRKQAQQYEAVLAYVKELGYDY